MKKLTKFYVIKKVLTIEMLLIEMKVKYQNNCVQKIQLDMEHWIIVFYSFLEK
jgi:hypothetical protein